MTSVISLTEVLTRPIRTGDHRLREEYKDLLLHSENLELVSIDAGIAEQAADLRGRYNLRTPDAYQVAVAMSMGREAFLTNDPSFKRVLDLRVLLLDQLISA